MDRDFLWTCGAEVLNRWEELRGTRMLREVTIRRFKNVESATLPMAPINVLVGTNNSGKSTVLHALQFAVSLAQTARAEGPQIVGDRASTTLNPENLIYAPLRDVFTLARGGNLRQSESSSIQVVFVEDVAEGEPPSDCTVQVRRGKNRNLAVQISGGESLKQRLSDIESPFAMYVPGLAGVAVSESYRSPAVLRRAAARGDANSVFRNVLYKLHQDQARWASFSDSLGQVFPDHSISVDFEPERDEHIDARVVSGGFSLPIDAAGTGFLQTAQILAYAAAYSPRLLLLDEPDSHIHPDKQRSLVRVLSALAAGGDFQVFIATHSRHLLDELEGHARFHWFTQGNRLNEQSFDRVRALMELGALDRSDRLRSGIVAGVVLTEDAAAADGHPRSAHSALRTLLSAAGVPMDRVQVWSYNGCTNVQTARVLAEFIRENAPGARVLVHRDRDYLPEEDVHELRKKLVADGLFVFVTEGTDAESYFVNVNHIMACHAGLVQNAVEEAVRTATAGARDDSLRRFADAQENRFRYAKDKPNAHDLATERSGTFDADPPKYRYGKKVLGLLTAQIQELLGDNPALRQATEHVKVPELVSFAQEVARAASSP